MYHHALTFNDTDAGQLRETYHALMNELDRGKGMEAGDLDDLTESMREILYHQPSLDGFWQQVQQQPQQSFHLHITHADKELLNLPWQAALQQEHASRIRLSKGSPGITSFPEYLPKAGPLKILVMISSPQNLEHDERLSYEQEEQSILKALEPLWEAGQVQVDFTENGSLEKLQERIRLQHYHILYFSGHGTYKNNTGYLQLEDPVTQKMVYITAQQLAKTVTCQPEYTPALVILASCHTAQGRATAGFRGVADELAHHGVPAVIAMAFSIKDQYATIFSAYLYASLAKRETLLQAYAHALEVMKEREQQAIHQAGSSDYHPTQWMIPQLYCDQQVSHLVDWQAPMQALKVANTELITGDKFLLLSPHKGYHFIGRRRESAALFNQLVNGQAVLLRGQGGVGKTALAEHLVKRLLTHDPSYHCFAFNEVNMGMEAMIAQLQDYLGHTQPPGNNIIENETQLLDLLLKQVTLRCRPVWFFDNMESFQEGETGPINAPWMNYLQSRLLNQFPIIFTGRYPIAELPGIFEMNLNEVSFIDYYQKCQQLNLRNIQQEKYHLDLTQVALILYHSLGGSYRALEFFDEIYTQDRQLVGGLLEEISALTAKAQHNEAEKMTRTFTAQVREKLESGSKKLVLAALLKLLSEPALQTLSLLVFFKRPVMKMALEMQQPGRTVEEDLQQLTTLNLVEEHTKEIAGDPAASYTLYYVTPVTRDWLGDLSLPRVPVNLEKAGDYFKDACNDITHVYGDMEAAFSFYAGIPHIDKVNETGAIITNEYFRKGMYELTLFYGHHVEAIAGDRTDPDVLNNLGLTNLMYARYDDALPYLTKHLIIARQRGDKYKETLAMANISEVFRRQKDNFTAIQWLEKGRDLAVSNKDGENEAMALSMLGTVYAGQNEYERAQKMFEQSLAIRQRTGNRKKEGLVLNNLSSIYSERGDYQKVLEILNRSLSIAMEIGDKWMEGTVLGNIGMTYDSLEQFEVALGYLQKSLVVRQQIGDREGEGQTLYNMGGIYKLLGRHNDAIECITKASVLLRQFGYKNLEADTSFTLGDISVQEGDHTDGIPLLQESLDNILATGGDVLSEATVREELGWAHYELGEFDKAIQHLKKSLARRRALRDWKAEGFLLIKLSQVYMDMQDFDKALEVRKKNLALQRKHADRQGEGLALHVLASSYLHMNDIPQYLLYEQESYDIIVEVNDEYAMFLTGLTLSNVLCTSGEPAAIQKGVTILQKCYELAVKNKNPEAGQLRELINEYTAKLNPAEKKS